MTKTITQSISRRTLITVAASCLFASAPAWAQSGAPLRVILPVGAGSGVDTIARTAQNALSKALGGQTVVIENLPGAGGITGTQALVKAPPDGNTIAFISNNHAVNPSVFKKLPYDSLADITPISQIGSSPFVLVVNPAKVPVKDAKELQAMLKAKPGGYNFGSSGNGTIIHLAGEMFVDAAGVQVQHVPYKGMGPVISDLLGGQIEFAASSLVAVAGQIKSGQLRALGVMGKQRSSILPDLPTLAEQGFADVDVAGWFAVIGPKGLPTAQVQRLHKALVTAFADPEVMSAMQKVDNHIRPTSPEGAAQFLKSEQDRYARLVSKANIKLD